MSIFGRRHPFILAFLLLVFSSNIYADEDHPGGDLVPAYADEWTTPTWIRDIALHGGGAIDADRLDNGNFLLLTGYPRGVPECGFQFDQYNDSMQLIQSQRSQAHNFDVQKLRHFRESNGDYWLIADGPVDRHAIRFTENGDQRIGDGIHSVELNASPLIHNWILGNHPENGIIYASIERPDEGNWFEIGIRHYSTGFAELIDSSFVIFSEDVIYGDSGIRNMSGIIHDGIIHAVVYAPYVADGGLVRGFLYYTQLALDGEILLQPELITVEEDSLFDNQLYQQIPPVIDDQGNLYFVHDHIYGLESSIYLTIKRHDGSVSGGYLSTGGESRLVLDAFNNVHAVFKSPGFTYRISYTRLHSGDIETMLPIQSIGIENEHISLTGDIFLVAHPTKSQVDLFFKGIRWYQGERPTGLVHSRLRPASEVAQRTFDEVGNIRIIPQRNVDFSPNLPIRVFNILGQQVLNTTTQNIYTQQLHIPSGIYFLVQTKDQQEMITNKIFISR